MLHSVQPKGKKSQNIVNFKNERLIIFIETSDGPLILVLVGALLVGSISTNWGNRYHPNQNCDIITEDNLSYEFAKGESIATFHYGSSVILISDLSLESIKLGPCRMGASLWS